MLKRKIDVFLHNWKNDPTHKPLIVRGARQIGKTYSIRSFGRGHYYNMVEINFALQPQFLDIFRDGYEPGAVIRNISIKDPDLQFRPSETLIFFDELQALPNAATSLKFFAQDGRFDVICSGSLMGLAYQEIESNSVGYKQDYIMHSLDFEEFLWALGFRPAQIDDLYDCMIQLQPLSQIQMETMTGHFQNYMILGGMPEIVQQFVTRGEFSGSLEMQRQLWRDYEEDITKYARGLDQAKVLNVWRKIPVFLGEENKKFHISKITPHARTRDYVGVVEWLQNAGLINVCHCLQQVDLPLHGNYQPDNYKLYLGDTGLLIGQLDDEVQQDLRYNRNFNAYKGALYENMVAEMLTKQGYELYFYRNEKSTIEMDFFVRDRYHLIPVEVKAQDGSTISLKNLVTKGKYPAISFGIKLCAKNIGVSGQIITLPYFLAFLLRRFLLERSQRELA